MTRRRVYALFWLLTIGLPIAGCGSSGSSGTTTSELGEDGGDADATGPGDSSLGSPDTGGVDANGDALLDSGSHADSGGHDGGVLPDASGSDGEGAMDSATTDAVFDAPSEGSGPTANVVFATSTTSSAAMGGLAGADAICAARAAAAGLSGTFVAWLATSTATAVSRLGSSRGWVRTDGLPVADTTAQLGKLALYYPIDLDESGNPLAVGERAFTGVWANGSNGDLTATCNDWTDGAHDLNGGLSGKVHYGTGGWSYDGEPYCDTPSHLYCFQTDHVAAVKPAPPPAGARIAFRSTRFFDPSSGIAGADALCASEASTAHMTGTFEALLATTTATAISRFDTTAGPWYRPDGVQVVVHAVDLASAILVAPITVSASLNGLTNTDATISVGASAPNTLAMSADCADWSSSLTTAKNMTGLGSATDGLFFGGSSTASFNCAYNFTNLYCLQR